MGVGENGFVGQAFSNFQNCSTSHKAPPPVKSEWSGWWGGARRAWVMFYYPIGSGSLIGHGVGGSNHPGWLDDPARPNASQWPGAIHPHVHGDDGVRPPQWQTRVIVSVPDPASM